MNINKTVSIAIGILLLGGSYAFYCLFAEEKQPQKPKTPIEILKEDTDADPHYEAAKKILSDYHALIKELTDIIKPENKYSDGSRAWAAYLLSEFKNSNKETIKALLSMTINRPFYGDPPIPQYRQGDGGWCFFWTRGGKSYAYGGESSGTRVIKHPHYLDALIKIGRPVVPEVIKIMKKHDAIIEIEVIEDGWDINYYNKNKTGQPTSEEKKPQKVKKQVPNRVITDSLDILRSILGGEKAVIELLAKLIKEEKDEKVKGRLKKTKASVEKWEEKK